MTVFITRSDGHVVERGRHTALPPGHRDEQLVPPHFQAERHVVGLHKLAAPDGRLSGLLVREREVHLPPAEHLSQPVVYRPHGARAASQEQYR